MDYDNNNNNNMGTGYNQPATINNQYYNQPSSEYKGAGVGEWMLTLFVAAIPCIGLIMLFVWAFGNSSEKKNWARAKLIWAIIDVILIALFWTVIGTAAVNYLQQ